MKKYLFLYIFCYFIALSCAQSTSNYFKKLEGEVQVVEIKILKEEVTVLSENITHKTHVINESNAIIKRLQKEMSVLQKEKKLLQKEVDALTTINENLRSQIFDLHKDWD